MQQTTNRFTQANTHADGAGVVVAVLDTGIAADLPHFSDCSFLKAISFQVNGNTLEEIHPQSHDPIGHGTGVAYLIHKLAPKATLIDIPILQPELRKHRHDAIRIGAQKAIEAGAHILNCSFGTPGTPYTLPLYKSWTDAAFISDRHIVSAASNADINLPEWPSHIMTTHGVHYADELWRYQSQHPIPFLASGENVEVLTPSGTMSTMTGSSFAAAHFTGILARFISNNLAATPSEVRNIFRQSAQA